MRPENLPCNRPCRDLGTDLPKESKTCKTLLVTQASSWCCVGLYKSLIIIFHLLFWPGPQAGSLENRLPSTLPIILLFHSVLVGKSPGSYGGRVVLESAEKHFVLLRL